jgi:ASC-1-like (ASCH) protein
MFGLSNILKDIQQQSHLINSYVSNQINLLQNPISLFSTSSTAFSNVLNTNYTEMIELAKRFDHNVIAECIRDVKRGDKVLLETIKLKKSIQQFLGYVPEFPCGNECFNQEFICTIAGNNNWSFEHNMNNNKTMTVSIKFNKYNKLIFVIQYDELQSFNSIVFNPFADNEFGYRSSDNHHVVSNYVSGNRWWYMKVNKPLSPFKGVDSVPPFVSVREMDKMKALYTRISGSPYLLRCTDVLSFNSCTLSEVENCLKREHPDKLLQIEVKQNKKQRC